VPLRELGERPAQNEEKIRQLVCVAREPRPRRVLDLHELQIVRLPHSFSLSVKLPVPRVLGHRSPGMANPSRPIIGWRTPRPRAASHRPHTAMRDWLNLHSPGKNENEKKIKIE
jgi:hypothetical protein